MRAIAILLLLQFGISVDVEVLEIEVSVVDRDGKPVEGLRAEDFEVTIGGRSVPVTNFYPVARGVVQNANDPGEPRRSMPTRFVIFVDDMHLDPTEKGRVMNGLREYVERRLDGTTSVMIVRWNDSLTVMLQPTTDRETVLRAIDVVAAEPPRIRARSGEIYESMADAGIEADVLAQHRKVDTIRFVQESQRTIEGLHQIMTRIAGMEGRKILMFVSRGIYFPPEESLEAKRLKRSYADLARVSRQSGIVFTMFHPRLEVRRAGSTLDRLAVETGGRTITPVADVAAALATLNDQLTTWYSLGVRAPEKQNDGDIVVRVRDRPELRVLAPSKRTTLPREERIEAAVRSRLFLREEQNPLQATAQIADVKRRGAQCVASVVLTAPSTQFSGFVAEVQLNTSIAIRMMLLDDREGESPLRKLEYDLRVPVGKTLRTSFTIAFQPRRKYVLSLGVTDVMSGETSYLQREIDAGTCR